MGYAGSQFHCGPDYLNNPLVQIPVLPPDPFAATGAQDIPFLRSITALQGVGANALSAILTGSLNVPYLVQILDPSGSGAVQVWSLQTSTLATGAGVQRPNDWASPSNTKVWIQIS